VSDPNDKLLDDYLRRDSVVSARYRELDANEVPSSLDDAVLAQARVAVESRKKSQPNWMRWGAPVALAASAVMAVAIVLEIGVEDEVRMPTPRVEPSTQSLTTAEERVVQEAVQEVIQDAPVTTAVPPPPRLEAPKPLQDEQALVARREARARAEAKSTERAAIESITVQGMRRYESPQDSPSPVKVMVSDDEVPVEPDESTSVDSAAHAFAQSSEQSRDTQESEATIATGSRFGTQARARTAAPSSIGQTSAVRTAAPAPAAAQQAPRLAPDVWLEQIRVLRREGKMIEADEQWKEFSVAYPRYEVATTDSARPTQ
jgi:hypothetical protein